MDELARGSVSESAADGSSAEGETESDASFLDRRTYLKLGATAAGVVAVGSRVGRAAGTTRHGIEFDRVLNAVEDLGMDPDGERPIDDAFYGAMDDGTLVEFPPGRYLFTEYRDQRELNRFGVRGLGAHRRDVEFVTPPGESSYFLWIRDGSDILLENLTFQQRMRRDGGDIGNVIRIRDGLQIHDVEFAGFNTSGDTDRWALLPKLTDPDGEGLVTNLVHTGPSDFKPHGVNDGAGGVFHGHRGTITFRDCHIENAAGDGGLYTGKHEGAVNFENCLFKNNDMAVMRLGAGSYIRDSTVVIDWDDAHPDNTGDPGGVNGLYFSSGPWGKTGGGVYNCDVIARSAYRDTPAMGVIAINASDGDVTIEDTRIRNDIDGQPAVFAYAPGERFSSHGTPPEDQWGITIDGVSVTGSARSERGAIVLDKRPESVVRDCCIQMEHGDGIYLEDSPDCVVENTCINVPGEAVGYVRSSAETRDLRYDESCPVPSERWRRSDDADGSSDDSDGRSSGADDGTSHHLKLHSEEASPYSFSVSGDLEFDPAYGTEDYLEGNSVRGFLVGGTDAYRFTGAVTDFEVDGPVEIELDGTAVTADELRSMSDPDDGDGTNSGSSGGDGDASDDSASGDDSSDGGSSLEESPESTESTDGATKRHLKLHSEEASPYSFSVSGDLEFDPAYGTEDYLEGNSVRGFLVGGTDAYRFTGAVTDFEVDGPVEIELDGTAVTADELRSMGDPAPSRTLAVVGTGDAAATYRFTVSGGVAPDPDVGSIDAGDNISGGSAEGAVLGGTDGYLFSGSVTDFQLDGQAAVYVDGRQVDPGLLASAGVEGAVLPHTFVVDGTGSDPCSYTLAVDGTIVKHPRGSDDAATDTITGNEVTGRVEGGVDAYRFRGNLTKLLMNGTAQLSFLEE
ncbi:right-handed parallel beta-helix repeat-containing protein [Halomarina halobia]|uniref:Right-handed parallel beta-helix repeat-containing protein n=1 Tax=Halomarina halobia TaxID=3033386 RepID=A0ABD6A9N4_9EURY|nr:right-handed parallel beta-helix repeat-containing protein [Halomarina sp. PSR21]